MMTFVRVMMDEGLAVSTLADRVGVKPNTISSTYGTWDMLAAVENQALGSSQSSRAPTVTAGYDT